MSGYSSPDPRLQYDFDTNAKLEIQIHPKGKFSSVDCNVFRSWTGPRKLNGKPYLGPRYNFLTNDASESVVSEATVTSGVVE